MVATLSQVEGFLGRSAYVDAKFQSSYSNYVIYEFANLAALFEYVIAFLVVDCPVKYADHTSYRRRFAL